jgi:L-ascorbate metabolism protein UlaG (beta-lactamase superfamily)
MSARAVTSSLSVTFAGHATVLLELDGVRLLTDPLLRKRIGVLIRRSPVPSPEVRRDLDAVLISHAHLDHLDVPSLRLIDRRTPVVAPRGLGALLRRLGFVPLEMDVGDEVEIKRLGGRGGEPGAVGASSGARVRVRAVPADHAGTRYPLAAESPALGYVVAGGLSAYFAGDTGLYEGMRDLAPEVDVRILRPGETTVFTPAASGGEAAGE